MRLCVYIAFDQDANQVGQLASSHLALRRWSCRPGAINALQLRNGGFGLFFQFRDPMREHRLQVDQRLRESGDAFRQFVARHAIRRKFATYTRDSSTGVDYADQRCYASMYGRFNTPDPMAGSAGAKSPGSWNRYNYAMGDPVNGSDPSGLCSEALDGS
jgi:RHS repeat-associated protein